MSQSNNPTADPHLDQAAELISRAGRVVALTGAGVSVDSGIPDFRGAQGLWAKYDPREYAHIDSFTADPAKVWTMLKDMDDLVVSARPNAIHLALARLEALGRLQEIITQNVDNLHQAAGSSRVIEFHGNAASLSCQACGRTFTRADLDLSQLPPRCGCDGPIKPDVIFFGEAIPEQALADSVRAAAACEVMLVVGTSALVAPASHMPLLARQVGAKIIEINLEETQLSAYATDMTFIGQGGLILPALVELVAAKLSAGA